MRTDCEAGVCAAARTSTNVNLPNQLVKSQHGLENCSHLVSLSKRSNLHYTRDITPKRVTSDGSFFAAQPPRKNTAAVAILVSD